MKPMQTLMMRGFQWAAEGKRGAPEEFEPTDLKRWF